MLDLAENQLTDLELLYASNLAAASAPNLSRLSLHHNHLTTASFRASTDTNATNTTTDTAGVFLGHPVQFLDLSYTGVDSLPLVIQHFPNLVSLNLSYCGIDDGRLAGLDAGVQLREVVLRGNLFTEITDYPRKKGITLDVAGTDVQCACWMVGVLDAGEQQWKGLDCMTDPARLTALRALCAAPGVGSHLFLPLLVIIGALLVIGAAFSCYLCYRYRPQMYSDWLRCTCLRKLCGNRHEDRKPSELMAFVSATNSSTPTMQSVSPTPELHDPAQFIRAHAQPVLHDAGDPRRVFEKNDDSASDDEEEDSCTK
ncbi:uncharacterized protein LOC129598774 [Paramacrobiotus metropolitanus]|uniref:uncharacterized protein LOC129598774 n=1 Tax=Paramacrobiotus metropolitanus TaxID=2943436 RepID=UPI002445EFF1|nr:uncharacterized protein LOC129598774 [Paramacrobiotus metropolitanus]